MRFREAVERIVRERRATREDSLDSESPMGNRPSGQGSPIDRKLGLAALNAELFGADASTRGDDVPEIGRFQVHRKLGQGGMGIVYACQDPENARMVAIKWLHAREHQALRTRFLREAEAMASLDHPNILRVFEIGEHGGQPFTVMELIEGETLSTWLQGEERPLGSILDAFARAGAGLAAAHDEGLVHRDFKPDNVMVADDGRVVVMDFGLVRVTTGAAAGLAGDLTATGAILGTPGYMAPEQLLGEHADARADQFSFCVALWEALFHVRPFLGRGIVGLTQAILSSEPRGDDRVVIPRGVRELLVRGLAAKPASRWPSMDELLAEFARCRSAELSSPAP
jgi:serine/threonine protein kinase